MHQACNILNVIKILRHTSKYKILILSVTTDYHIDIIFWQIFSFSFFQEHLSKGNINKKYQKLIQ